MAIREGRWRCPYCSRVSRGEDFACGGCGATRDKDVTFFLEEDAPEVVDQALLKKAEAGADWLCLFCQTSNTPDSRRCLKCGAEKGTSPSRPVREIPEERPPAPRASTQKGFLGLLAVVALVVCGVATYFALRKTGDDVTVKGFHWERTVDIEAYRTVRDKAWDGEVPPGAREVSRQSELHHTDRIPDGTRRVKVGTRDMGNGFFKDVFEERPVYKDRPAYRARIIYEVQRWVHDRTERAEGQDQSPRWPGQDLGPGRREGQRTERYLVLLKGREKVYQMELPLDRWSALRVGESFKAVIRGGSKVLEIHDSPGSP
jgi:hypothetical protein